MEEAMIILFFKMKRRERKSNDKKDLSCEINNITNKVYPSVI